MPINREPHIYQGYVISMIGTTLGQEVEMEYKNAQACVANGTARWADDETDLPNHVKTILAEQEAEQAATDKANAEHNARLRAEREAQERADANARGGYLYLHQIEGNIFLARPFPDTVVFDKSVLDVEGGPLALEQDGDQKKIIVTLANASAVYLVKLEDEISYLGELLSHESPDVDIPDDWREKRALELTRIAKKIRGTKEPMSGPEATAIIEEWVKADDKVPTEKPAPVVGDAEAEAKAKGERGNAADPNFKDGDGNQISPEERAKQAAQDLANDGQND